jgi:dinuclear metal center YbgI/SA1388 family protein
MRQLREVIALLDDWFPAATAADWDAVGLVWGDPESPVHRVLFAVDPSPAVAREAAEWGADVLVVHHPLFLRPVHGLPRTDPKGRVIGTLADAGCALYTAHTNADQASGGVSESLALALGLTDLEPILPGSSEPTGQGRLGRVPETTLAAFAAIVAARLPPTAAGLRIAGDPDRPVRRVAVCGGSGDFLLDQLVATEVDVYVTSDLRHHRATEFLEHGGPALIDVSHWAAEWTWLPVVADRLSKATGAGMSDSVETRVSLTPTDPWSFRI